MRLPAGYTNDSCRGESLYIYIYKLGFKFSLPKLKQVTLSKEYIETKISYKNISELPGGKFHNDCWCSKVLTLLIAR